MYGASGRWGRSSSSNAPDSVLSARRRPWLHLTAAGVTVGKCAQSRDMAAHGAVSVAACPMRACRHAHAQAGRSLGWIGGEELLGAGIELVECRKGSRCPIRAWRSTCWQDVCAARREDTRAVRAGRTRPHRRDEGPGQEHARERFANVSAAGAIPARPVRLPCTVMGVPVGYSSRNTERISSSHVGNEMVCADPTLRG